MKLIFELIQIFVCLLEAYLMFDFFVAFFPLREIFRKRFATAAIVLGTAACVRCVNIFGSSGLNIVAMQVIYISLLAGMFCGTFLKKTFCYIVATVIMIGSEFLWIVFMSHPSNFSLGQMDSSMDTAILSMLCTKLIAFVLLTYVKTISHNSFEKMKISDVMLYSIVPISTIGIMVALAYLNIIFDSSRFVHILLLSSIMLVIMGNLLIFYVFDRYSVSMEKLRQQEIVITKLEMEEKRYEQIENVNQEHAKFLHDIRHYMKAIGELAASNSNKQIVNILSDLQVKVSEAETEMLCRNAVLNAILNEKKKEAEKRDIYIKIKIEPEFMVERIENIDLIAIMGNLLDNALEAASKCAEGFIKVYMFSQNEQNFSIIKIVNNYVEEISKKNNVIITNKTDTISHGFGIQNVNEAAKKYGGYLESIYEDGIFTSIVILPNQNF